MLMETADDEILEIDAAALVTQPGVFGYRFFGDRLFGHRRLLPGRAPRVKGPFTINVETRAGIVKPALRGRKAFVHGCASQHAYRSRPGCDRRHQRYSKHPDPTRHHLQLPAPYPQPLT